MPYVKNTSYREIPLSESSEGEFYTYSNITDLIEKCKLDREGISRCRTIGILHSVNGRFFLSDLKSPTYKDDDTVLRLSMRYLETPPTTAIKVYPVQVFGTLQWYKRPVLFVNILQVLSIPMAIRLAETMSSVVCKHLAQCTPD